MFQFGEKTPINTPPRPMDRLHEDHFQELDKQMEAILAFHNEVIDGGIHFIYTHIWIYKSRASVKSIKIRILWMDGSCMDPVAYIRRNACRVSGEEAKPVFNLQIHILLVLKKGGRNKNRVISSF